MKQNNISRRVTLAGAAAILAGCSTRDNNPQPDPQPDNGTQSNEPKEPEDPTNNSSTDKENNEDNEPEEQEEQNSSWNWNNVLEEEQIHREEHKINNLAERALNGEKIGPELSNDIDNWRYEYSHGKGHWDLQHFQELDLTNEKEFMQAVNDALTLPNHYMNSKEGAFASEWRTEMGETAEKILEQAHDTDNLHIWGWGNDGHGFNYILSEDHGVFTVDGATPAIGRAGTNPLEDAPYGNDIVSQFEQSWLKESSDVPEFKANIAQNFATNSMYSILGKRANEQNVGVHLDILPNVFDKFKAEDSGEFLWNQYRPAVATSVYRREAEDFAEDEGIVINPDKLEDLPDLRNYDDFTEYLSDLENHTEKLRGEEAVGPVYLP